MKKILFILICFAVCACSKEDEKETPSPFGQWMQVKFADNPQFNNADTITNSIGGEITIELNAKDSCRYFVHIPGGEDFLSDKSWCTITNESITIHGGRFSPYTNYYAQEGSVIVIHELTPKKMILKWTTQQVFAPFLPSGIYYTELKRVK